MSRAVECDSCGALVRFAEALRLDGISVPRASSDCASVTWSEVDICRECLGESFLVVLGRSCTGFEFPIKEEIPDDPPGGRS